MFAAHHINTIILPSSWLCHTILPPSTASLKPCAFSLLCGTPAGFLLPECGYLAKPSAHCLPAADKKHQINFWESKWVQETQSHQKVHWIDTTTQSINTSSNLAGAMYISHNYHVKSKWQPCLVPACLSTSDIFLLVTSEFIQWMFKRRRRREGLITNLGRGKS